MKRRTPLTLWIAVPTLAAAAFAWTEPQSRRDPLFARTGIVGSWRLDVNGTLYLRLDHEDAKRPGSGDETQTSTWFRTPPDRNAQVRVEELLMEILMQRQALAEPEPITVEGKVERALDGSTPDQAIPILAIEG